MRQLLVALLFLAATLLASRSALAACSPQDAAIGAHNGATVEVMCRGETACYTNPCYGRCGPSCNWTVLGNYYTSACQTHDGCIENRACNYGDSSASAQANCAYLLPNAIWSLSLAAWYDGSNWVRDTATGVWNSIRHIF